MIDVRKYLDPRGRSLCGIWFDRLHPQAAAKVATALTRLARGNFSNVKGVGSGLFECRIDFGAGYRIYFGKDGERLVLLTRRLAGIQTQKEGNPHASDS